eukprot:7655482-Alexandrium_andersonii.AAC.1
MAQIRARARGSRGRGKGAACPARAASGSPPGTPRGPPRPGACERGNPEGRGVKHPPEDHAAESETR